MRSVIAVVLTTLGLASGFVMTSGPSGAGEEPKNDAAVKPITTNDLKTCFLCQYCAKCHCTGDRSGNEDLNVCDIKSLTETPLSEKMKKKYPTAKAYLVPGKPEESVVWLRIHDESMPKGDKKPTPEQSKKFKEWIASLKKK